MRSDKENMGRRLKKAALLFLPDLLSAGGAMAITAGVSMISVAGGWIIAGILLIAAAVIVSRGGRNDDI